MASIVGSNIRRLRKQSGSSRYRLAELACPSQSWICRIESGDENNTLASLTRIARALPVEGADLLREPAGRVA
jgi:predicted transcriptional regulator